jgi:hypothetical protein
VPYKRTNTPGTVAFSSFADTKLKKEKGLNRNRKSLFLIGFVPAENQRIMWKLFIKE